MTQIPTPTHSNTYIPSSIYCDMLDCVTEVTVDAVVNEIKSAECFTLQLHGSVDQYSADNKFITARYLGEKKKQMKT